MERSKSQVLYRYLPGSVYHHEDEIVVRTTYLRGPALDWSVNKEVLLDEIENQMEHWPDDQIQNLPYPSRVGQDEFSIINPRLLYWDIWPLVFACTRKSCGRVQAWYDKESLLNDKDDETGRLVCGVCGGNMRQLDYFAAHNCGRTQMLYAPDECSNCGSTSGLYLDDTGSFANSSWRCRDCNQYVTGTRQTPCNCDFTNRSGRAAMRMFTVRDNRPFYPQFVTMINMDTTIYRELDKHHRRNEIALAAYLGDVQEIRDALSESDAGDEGRYTPEQWKERREELKKLVDQEILKESEFEDIKEREAPDRGSHLLRNEVDSDVLELGNQRRVLERAIIFDSTQMNHYTLDDARGDAIEKGRTTSAQALKEAQELSRDLGIRQLSVTMDFPIVAAAYGYTRVRSQPGEANLQSFALQSEQYDGDVPIFAVDTDTEALLISLSARQVLEWLSAIEVYSDDPPAKERTARLNLLEMFAASEEGDDGQIHPAAHHARVLVHSFSHCMQHALADGKTGVGEASLSEWMVPETLTFGIYVSSFQSYTLGALWSLLRNRARLWLQQTYEMVWRCENDPFCHQREPRACERCLYVTFGCSLFNDDLSRRLMASFWRHTYGSSDEQPFLGTGT